jgi:hypothetical protein
MTRFCWSCTTDAAQGSNRILGRRSRDIAPPPAIFGRSSRCCSWHGSRPWRGDGATSHRCEDFVCTFPQTRVVGNLNRPANLLARTAPCLVEDVRVSGKAARNLLHRRAEQAGTIRKSQPRSASPLGLQLASSRYSRRGIGRQLKVLLIPPNSLAHSSLIMLLRTLRPFASLARGLSLDPFGTEWA